MRRVALTLALLALGCGEPEPTVRPLQAGPRARDAPRAPELLDPGMRVRQSAEQAEAERVRLGVGGGSSAPGGAGGGGGGGGGGGSTNPNAEPWVMPSIPDPPTAREVEAFQRALAEQQAEHVDPEDDPCMQLRGSAIAGANAAEEATPGETLRGPATPRDRLREGCRAMREDMQRCLAQDYFRDHVAECERELARLGRAGQRSADAARARLDAIDRGDAPDPTERRAPE